ncbi:sporulation integral membrane protein YtvI [Alkalibacillus aidingensis]|uniref:sporulation integral membrane protein YtvI n=1 Tax=Alkalibacillus aidingensis TaxID=2747607 RepID=UPI001660EC56|nr:sporulation integral membrane protein YtvI [Alkalibacillus aidingensis]
MEINYVNLLKLISALIGLILLLYFGLSFFLPILISFLLAISINPIVNSTQKLLIRNRALSVLFVLCLLFISFISVISLAVVEFIQLLQYLTSTTPAILEDLFEQVEIYTTQTVEQVYQTLENFASNVHPESQQMMKSLLTDMTQSMKDASKNWLVGFLQSSMSQLSSLIQNSYVIIFILIATYFISKDGPTWMNYIKTCIPQSNLLFIQKLKSESNYLIKKYLFAQALLILITGCIVYVGLVIFNIEHALAIALVAMFLDIIPLIGVSGIFIPWILYLFIDNQFTLTIQLSILLIIIIIMRNILEPKLIGSSLGIHPFVVLVLLFVLIKTFGILGIVLSPILTILIVSLLRSDFLLAIKRYVTK